MSTDFEAPPRIYFGEESLDVYESSCPVKRIIDSSAYGDKENSLVKIFIAKQAEAAEEMLGDTRLDGVGFINKCLVEAGLDGSLPIDRAKAISKDVNKCLSRRYLGVCYVNGQCNDADDITEVISELDLHIPFSQPTD